MANAVKKSGSRAPTSSVGPIVDSNAKRWQRICSITLILPIIFALQVIIVVVLVWAIVFFNSQHSISDLSSSLQREIVFNIRSKTNSLLNDGPQIEDIIFSQLKTGVVTLNLNSLRQQLRPIFLSFQTVGSVYVALPDNTISCYTRVSGLSQYLERGPTDNITYIYSIDNNTGIVTEPPVPINLIPTGRPWYIKAVEKRQPTWTDLFVDIQEQNLDITAAAPIINSTNEILGVIGIDYVTEAINEFLHSVHIVPHGRIFIMDKQGLMVAASAGDLTDNASQRIAATNSSDKVIAATASLIPGIRTLDAKSTYEAAFYFDSQMYYVVCAALVLADLDWNFIVVIPESDIMYSVIQGTIITYSVTFGLLIILVAFSLCLSLFIVIPLNRLNSQMRQVARLSLEQNVKHRSAMFWEIRNIQYSFVMMTQSLNATVEKMMNQERKTRATLDALDDIVVTASAEGLIFNTNQAFDSFFGFTDLEMQKGIMLNILFENQPFNFFKNMGANDKVRATAVTKQGAKLPVLVTVRKLQDQQNNTRDETILCEENDTTQEGDEVYIVIMQILQQETSDV
jgi:PAS domain-containing protein